MGRTFRRLVAILILLGVAGCSDGIDPEQARVCRTALVALVPEAGAIDIRAQHGLPSAEGSTGVAVDYAAGHPMRQGTLRCRFVDTGRAGASASLVDVQSDTERLTDTGLYFLRRFWLDTPEGDRADPQPVAVWEGAPTVPSSIGYVLQIFLNALPSMASYGLLATSYSLIYGLVGRINLSFGEMAAIGGAGALTGLGFLREPPIATMIGVAVMVAVWTAVLHGVAIGHLVFTPLRRSTRQQGLVATVGLALVLSEYLRLVQGPTPLWVAPLRTAPIAIVRTAGFPVTVTPLGFALTVISAFIACGVLAVMRVTQFGRDWRAMADDAGAAALMGVSPSGTFARTFALSTALAGASGATVVLLTGSFGASYGATLGLKALLAAVLGGIGSIRGALLGGIALGGLEAGWSAFFPIENRDLVVFVVLAGALVARPGGLFGYGDLLERRV